MSGAAFDLAGKRVFVAGHRGMVGSAVVRQLAHEQCEVITAGRDRLDLLNQQQVDDFMAAMKPDVVIDAAAKVGGIMANDTRPAEFLFDNLVIQNNLIGAAHKYGVKKLTFLGSSCIYPKMAKQPIPESELLAGPLEPTNEWYAIAKIAGIKLCQAFRRQYGDDFVSCMPTNLYGPGDNFNLTSSHVLPALIAKAHTAKAEGRTGLPIWGTGSPLREFMHVDDCASAIIFVTKNYSAEDHINIGSGEEVSIYDLAALVKETVGLSGDIVTDPSKPDGTPRKLMDSTRLRGMGWSPAISLKDGLRSTYDWYLRETAAGAHLRQ